MLSISKLELILLYNSNDISKVWNLYQNKNVINHPQHGLISPNKYRDIKKGKPCPYCGQKMVHGKEFYVMQSELEARKRGYEYINKNGKKIINNIRDKYFHPNYINLDHKINKARCPEKMFDYDNLEAICWKCNSSKGDDNTYEIQHTSNYLKALVEEALIRYPTL
jgi:hypothetical protein